MVMVRHGCRHMGCLLRGRGGGGGEIHLGKEEFDMPAA